MTLCVTQFISTRALLFDFDPLKYLMAKIIKVFIKRGWKKRREQLSFIDTCKSMVYIKI